MEPAVSVLMAVYNGEPFLRHSLDSIFGQNFSNFELILVNDASTDLTSQIIAEYKDDRLITITNQRNLGLTKSLIKGLTYARSEYIARHDADDISLPDRFGKQLAVLRRNPYMSLLGTSFHMIDDDGRILETSRHSGSNAELQKLLAKKNIYCHGSAMFRKSAVDKVGGYRVFFPTSQDYDLFLRLAEVGEIGYLEEPLYLFRFHGNSISRTKRDHQLACRYFANELAMRRRANLDEIPPPEDIVAGYPPKNKDLFLDARGTAYLFFVAGDLHHASEAFERAIELSSDVDLRQHDWERWVLNRANAIAALRVNIKAGKEFIIWSVSLLSEWFSNKQLKILLRNYYVEQAFSAYVAGRTCQVISSGFRAYQSDLTALKDRGLGVIVIKAIFGRAAPPDFPQDP